jgi:hypothetical protein
MNRNANANANVIGKTPVDPTPVFASDAYPLAAAEAEPAVSNG